MRHVTHEGVTWTADTDDTPAEDEMEGARFRIYTLCPCDACLATGKDGDAPRGRCKACRGEGRILTLKATATDPESVGVALVTLGREGELEGCPVGLLDRPEGQTGKWIILPWDRSPSARNISAAGRVLQTARTTHAN
jgi:hypothetical protein